MINATVIRTKQQKAQAYLKEGWLDWPVDPASEPSAFNMISLPATYSQRQARIINAGKGSVPHELFKVLEQMNLAEHWFKWLRTVLKALFFY